MIPKDVVQQAAKLIVFIRNCHANGTQPPPDMVHQLNEIQSAAKTRLNPEQYRQAETFLDQEIFKFQEASNQVTEGLRVQNAKHEASLRGSGLANAIRQSTKNMTTGAVDNLEDFHKIREGLPVSISTGKSRLNKTMLAEQVKKKYNVSLDDHVKRLDDCASIDDDDLRASTMRRYGLDEKTVKQWAEGGGLEFGLQAKMADQDEEAGLTDEIEIQPSDGDILRADILNGFAEADNTTPFDELDEFKQRNRDLLGEDSLHGTVARSFVASEEADNSAQNEADASGQN